MFVFGTVVSDGPRRAPPEPGSRAGQGEPMAPTAMMVNGHGEDEALQGAGGREAASTGGGKRRAGRRRGTAQKRARGLAEKAALERLHEEEQRLVKQLEETRARLKTQAAKRQGGAQGVAGAALLHALAPEVAMAPLPALGSSPRPVAQTNLMPVLNRDGQVAFEAALRPLSRDSGAASAASAASAGSPSGMPIFQLPPVSAQANVVNPLPRDLSDQERARAQEEQEARQQVQAALGLTEEEMLMFDGALTSGGGQGHGDGTDERVEELGGMLLPQIPVDARRLQRSQQPHQAARRRPKRGGKPRKTSSARKAAGKKSAKLRKELAYSLHNVEQLTQTMQQEITELQKEYPITSLRAQQYIKQWGAAKLQAVFSDYEKRKMAAAFSKWHAFLQQLELEKKQDLYAKMQGSAKISRVFAKATGRQVAAAFAQWARVWRFERDNEAYLAMTAASLAIQRVLRGHLGRERARRRRRYLAHREQHEAAAKLQKIFRGRRARDDVEDLRERRVLDAAALRLQRNYRARLARRRVDERRAFRVLETQAAVRVQTAWRRKKGQLAYHMILHARKENAAVRIQAVQRRRVAQQRIRNIRKRRRREAAACVLQCAWRSRKARVLVAKRRAAAAEQRAAEERVARRLQAVYRGHRGRLMFQLKLHAKYAKLEHQSHNVVKMQAVVRGRQGRIRAARRRKEYLEEMCGWARAWMETFDDDRADWVFVNSYTQETLLEPPPDGYTKKDGMLALLNGTVVEDPLIVAKREAEKHLVQCVECEQCAATRRCNECEDTYCDGCFEDIHLKGKLATHTFEWFQNGRPRAAEPEPAPQPTPALEEPDLGTGTASSSQWVEHFDDAYQLPYWYNAATQETTWDDPTGLGGASGSTSTGAASASEAAQAHHAWEEHEDGGVPFYYNAVTGETLWERPAEMDHLYDETHLEQGATAMALGGGGGEGAGAWQEHFTDDGAAYYFNQETGETAWEMPAGFAS